MAAEIDKKQAVQRLQCKAGAAEMEMNIFAGGSDSSASIRAAASRLSVPSAATPGPPARPPAALLCTAACCCIASPATPARLHLHGGTNERARIQLKACFNSSSCQHQPEQQPDLPSRRRKAARAGWPPRSATPGLHAQTRALRRTILHRTHEKNERASKQRQGSAEG